MEIGGASGGGPGGAGRRRIALIMPHEAVLEALTPGAERQSGMFFEC